MSEKPIIFSGPMVRAILEGRKTQTRRVVKVEAKNLVFDLVKAWKDGPHAGEYLHVPFRHKDEDWSHGTSERVFCPYGQPGDRLWVKETFCNAALDGYPPVYLYRADDDLKPDGVNWRPSIFCTRKASRLILEITAVRVERLQDIAHYDCQKEGLNHYGRAHWSCPGTDEIFTEGYHGYRWLWESINGAGSWALNPWVWVIEFRRVES